MHFLNKKKKYFSKSNIFVNFFSKKSREVFSYCSRKYMAFKKDQQNRTNGISLLCVRKIKNKKSY